MHGLGTQLPQPLRPNVIVGGRYRIDGIVGRGGTATVYRVTQLDVRRLRALKVLHDGDHDLRARLRREGRLLAMLRHPHIIRVDDALELEHRLALVMSLVRGETLADLLRRSGGLVLRRARRLGDQVLSALAAAHQAGVVHRDLKPRNVLLDTRRSRDHALVCDFGLAKSERPVIGGLATQSGLVMGTPAYVAPEQLGGLDQVDARGDVFAMGAVLYALLTGQDAFEGNTWEEIVANVRVGRYTPIRSLRPDVPAPLVEAIRAALQPAPDCRPPDATVLRELWRVRMAPSRSHAVRHGLPAPLPLFGAEDVVEAAVGAIERGRRVVVLHGPAGSGASAVARTVAHRVLPRFAGGGWWVPVDGLSEGRRLASAISTALGQGGLAPSGLAHALEQRGPTLLVLDAAEAVTKALETMLPWLGAADVTLLLTSRLWQPIPGAARIPIPRLDHEVAMRWLHHCIERAGGPSALPVPVSRRLVTLLDGHPRLLEQAAARLRSEAPTALIRALRSRPIDFGDDRWSWMMRRISELGHASVWGLATFVGGFTRDQALALVEDPATVDVLLPALVDAALVDVDTSTRFTRYRWGRQARAYARAVLRPSKSGRDAVHTRYVAGFTSVIAGLPSFAVMDDRGAAQPSLDDALATADHARKTQMNDLATAATLVAFRHFVTRGPVCRARSVVESTLREVVPSAPAAFRLHRAAGLAARVLGHHEVARTHARAARRTAEQVSCGQRLCRAALDLAEIERTDGCLRNAGLELAVAQDLLRQHPDDALGRWTALAAGRLELARGAIRRGSRHLKRAYHLSRQHGAEHCRIAVLFELGQLRGWVERPEAARRALQMGCDIAKRLGDLRAHAQGRVLLAELSWRTRHLEETGRHLDAALDELQALDSPVDLAQGWLVKAEVEITGAPERAEAALVEAERALHGCSAGEVTARLRVMHARLALERGQAGAARASLDALSTEALPWAIVRAEASCVAASISRRPRDAQDAAGQLDRLGACDGSRLRALQRRLMAGALS